MQVRTPETFHKEYHKTLLGMKSQDADDPKNRKVCYQATPLQLKGERK